MNIGKKLVREILQAESIKQSAEKVIANYLSGVLIGGDGCETQASLTICQLREALKGHIPESLLGEFIDVS